MSLKGITKPEDFADEIVKLNERLEKLEDDGYVKTIKDRLIEQLTNLQNQGDIEEIRKNLMRIETDIMASEIMSSIRYKEISKEESKELRDEVSKIVDSLSDKKEETIRRPKVKSSKPKRYFPLNAIKGKINKIITYIKESEKFNLKNKTSDIMNRISDIMAHIKEQKGLTTSDKMNGIIDLRNRTKAKREKVNLKNIVMEAISTLKYKPQHAKQNKYVAKGKEMAKKIRALSSNVAKGIVAKASLLRKKIAINIEQAKVQRQLKIKSRKEEKAKRKEQLEIEFMKKEEAKKEEPKEQEKSQIESIEDEKTTLYNRPKAMEKEDDEKKRQTEIELKEEKKVTLYIPKGGKSKRYTTERGTKEKIMRLAATVALFGAIGSMTAMTSRNVGKNNNSIYGESVRVTPEFLEEMGNNSTLGEETSKVKDTNKNAKPSQDKNNTSTNLGQNNTSNEKPSTKPVQNNNNNSKPNQSNSNKQEINNNTKPSQNTTNNTKPENNKNEIKKIYGGEISASENGIRTEEDILYAVNKMGWRKEIVDNIKEMMPGLLKMQTDFDLDPLCALAVFQWESNCGTAYEPGGSAYERENDFRLANTLQYRRQNGVMGLSKLGYTYYDSWSTAAYEFGNYVRNAKHYAESEKGAQTMKDLETFKGLSIFRNAGTIDAATYNQLKACLEKRVTLSDISNATRALTAFEMEEMAGTITSSINKQKSVSKAMSGR